MSTVRPFACRGSRDPAIWRLVVVLDGGESRVHPEAVVQTASLLSPFRCTVTNRRPEWMAPATFVEVRVGELGWRAGVAGTTGATVTTLAGGGSAAVPLVCFAALANAFTMAHEVVHVLTGRHTSTDGDLMAGGGFLKGARIDPGNLAVCGREAARFADRWFLPNERGGHNLPGFLDTGRLAGWDLRLSVPDPATWVVPAVAMAAGDECPWCVDQGA